MKSPFYQQNQGKIAKDPPKYLGRLAGECWRKVVPFLESTDKVQRIDTMLVELYCTNYEIYRQAYDDIKENGIQQPMYKPVQSPGSGDVVDEQFLGYKKNPAVNTLKDATDTLNKVGMQLGLTPKGRAELLAIADSDDKKISASESLKEFFGGAE